MPTGLYRGFNQAMFRTHHYYFRDCILEYVLQVASDLCPFVPDFAWCMGANKRAC